MLCHRAVNVSLGWDLIHSLVDYLEARRFHFECSAKFAVYHYVNRDNLPRLLILCWYIEVTERAFNRVLSSSLAMLAEETRMAPDKKSTSVRTMCYELSCDVNPDSFINDAFHIMPSLLYV